MWVKIDDRFYQHPKIVSVGPLGLALQVAALCYCNQYLTDGFIPWSAAKGLLTWEFLGPPDEDGEQKMWTVDAGHGMHGDIDFVIDLLLAAGIWEETKGGYLIHDYGDFQKTKEEVVSLQDIRQRAGRAGGKAKRKQNGSKTEAKAKQEKEQKSSKIEAQNKAKSKAKLKPVPDPDPSSSLRSEERESARDLKQKDKNKDEKEVELEAELDIQLGTDYPKLRRTVVEIICDLWDASVTGGPYPIAHAKQATDSIARSINSVVDSGGSLDVPSILRAARDSWPDDRPIYWGTGNTNKLHTYLVSWFRNEAERYDNRKKKQEIKEPPHPAMNHLPDTMKQVRREEEEHNRLVKEGKIAPYDPMAR